MFGFWGWLERSTKAAILRGAQGAVDELQLGAAGGADAEDAPALRLTFRPPAEEPKGEPAKGRRKAE